MKDLKLHGYIKIYQDISISEPYIYMNSMNNSITSPQYQLPSEQPWSVETIHWVP